MTIKQRREEREQALRDEGAASARVEMGTAAATPPVPSEKIQQINEAAFKDPGAVQSAHGDFKMPTSSGQTVVVACKLGIAWYEIQLNQIVPKFEQNMQGGRTVNEAIRVGPVVRLRGTAYPRGTPPDGFPPPPIVVGGAALNYGVDKEWFDEWLKQHRQDPLVMNKLIFAHQSDDVVRGAAKDMASLQSGLEPVNPKGDERIPKSTRRGTGAMPEVSEIEPGRAVRT